MARRALKKPDRSRTQEMVDGKDLRMCDAIYHFQREKAVYLAFSGASTGKSSNGQPGYLSGIFGLREAKARTM